MATAIEMQEELKRLGVELTGEENYNTLKSKLADAKKAAATPSDTTDKLTKLYYVWVKVRAYFDDEGQKRINPCFFVTESMQNYPRLLKAKSNVVEIFEGEINGMKIAQIARWSGVNPDKYRDASNETLLKVIIVEPQFAK